MSLAKDVQQIVGRWWLTVIFAVQVCQNDDLKNTFPMKKPQSSRDLRDRIPEELTIRYIQDHF